MSVALDLQANPLINPPSLPHDVPALDKIENKHFVPAFDMAMAEIQADIDAIKNNPDAPTYMNTIEALEYAGKMLNRIQPILSRFTSSKINDEIREIEMEINPKVSTLMTEIFQDEVLFARVAAIYNDPDSQHLGVEEAKILENTYKAFQDNGVHLPPEKKKRFIEIGERLEKLSTLFKKNVVETTEAFKRFVTDESELDGLPDKTKEEYKANAVAEGRPDEWLIVLEPFPEVIMTDCKNRALREELHNALWGVAYDDPQHDNHPHNLEMIKLKHEMAQIMGFATTADHILVDNMAKDAKTVNDFLSELVTAYKPAAEAYLQKVRDFAASPDSGEELVTDLQPWDVKFYGRALKQKLFSLNEEIVRDYFELKSVFRGAVQFVEKAFDVDFYPAGNKYPVEHPDIEVFEVFNKSSGAFVGLFHFNYYARPGEKSGGAWMGELRGRSIDQGGKVVTPIITNDCNYKKHTDGRPTLLYFGETETLFHEFGHGLQGLLSQAKYGSLAGTRVKTDEVELPSQFLEGFSLAKARDPNDPYGRHHITGEKIPVHMLDQLEAMRNFDAAYLRLRQIFYSMLDMKWHSTDPATISSVEDLEDSVNAEVSLMPRKHGAMSTSFTHLLEYAASYYGYGWDDVMAADTFEASQAHGEIIHKPFMQRMAEFIYKTGGVYSLEDQYVKVMGRGPDRNALYRREGIMPKEAEPLLAP